MSAGATGIWPPPTAGATSSRTTAATSDPPATSLSRVIAALAQAGRPSVSPARRRRLIARWLPELRRLRDGDEPVPQALPLSSPARHRAALLARSQLAECRALRLLVVEAPTSAIAQRLWVEALERRFHTFIAGYREPDSRLRRELGLAYRAAERLDTPDREELRRRIATLWTVDALPMSALSPDAIGTVVALAERHVATPIDPGTEPGRRILAIDTRSGGRSLLTDGSALSDGTSDLVLDPGALARVLELAATEAATDSALARERSARPGSASMHARLRHALDAAAQGRGRRRRPRIASDVSAWLHVGFRRLGARLGDRVDRSTGVACRILDRSGRGFRLSIEQARCGLLEVGDLAGIDVDGHETGPALVEVIRLRVEVDTSIEIGVRVLAAEPVRLSSATPGTGVVLLGRVGRQACEVFLPRGLHRVGETVGRDPRLGEIRSLSCGYDTPCFEQHRARFDGITPPRGAVERTVAARGATIGLASPS